MTPRAGRPTRDREGRPRVRGGLLWRVATASGLAWLLVGIGGEAVWTRGSDAGSGAFADAARRPPAGAHPQATPVYEAYAIRFGVIPAFRVAGLLAGASRDRTLDIPVMVWLLAAPDGRRVLIDSGFFRERLVQQWKVRDFRSPARAVADAGVPPEAITDIVLTHAHWDHAGGVDLFPNATVWIQEAEYAYYTGEAWQPGGAHGGVEPDDMLVLVKRNTAGRLRLVRGDAQEILPGIRCYIGGRHTWASQYVTVPIAGGTAVFASDNVYLYENLERHLPIAQTFDPQANLAAQDRMRTLATPPDLIVPGHDPQVFTRFPAAGPGIVRIVVR
jgi:glyoxylase-like metal-dependent hydrolase (beta-lactamase superfamily II)